MSDNQSDKLNVSKEGEGYKAVVTRYFDSQEQANQWGESVTVKDTPEKAASQMSIAEAEAINSNVNPAPIPAGADQAVSGAGQETDDGESETQYHAPHETGGTEANETGTDEVGDTGAQRSTNKKK
jgi:hypothetical protein